MKALPENAELTAAVAGEGGIPRCGRRAEHAHLFAAGYRDLAWGRLYEGHVNALQLIARLGTARQRLRAEHDAAAGKLFGVWNTEPAEGVRAALVHAGGTTLRGGKTFASGAGRVARALITIAVPEGGPQLAVVPMDEVTVAIDRSFWQRPYGMEASDSFAVDFTGVRLDADAAIGAPGDYHRSPWLTAGASRFVAVQAGGLARLVADFAAFVRRRDATDDALQLARLGECAIAARTAELWVSACAGAWARFDDEGAAAEHELLVTVDAARCAVERAVLDAAERVERGAGARGLLETEPFAQRLRDLRMYLRQPAIDATLARVARSMLDARASI